MSTTNIDMFAGFKKAVCGTVLAVTAFAPAFAHNASISKKPKSEIAEKTISSAKSFTKNTDELKTVLKLFPEKLETNSNSDFHKLKQELVSYKDLKDNWDSYGATPPTEGSVNDAINFLYALPEDIPLPKAMLSTSGEPSLYWDTDEGYADIAFDGPNQASFYMRKKSTDQEKFIDEVEILSEKDVSKAISSLRDFI